MPRCMLFCLTWCLAAADCGQLYRAFGPPCLVGQASTYRPGRHEVRESLRDAVRAVRCCQQHGGHAWELGLAQENGSMFGIFCGPPGCGRQEIALVALQHFLTEQLQMPISVPSEALAPALRLMAWDDLDLDFVVVGAERRGQWRTCDGSGRCGTSSVHFNLCQHPEIGFTQGPLLEVRGRARSSPRPQDYSIFMHGQRNMLVPTKDQLEAHVKARWPRSKRLLGLKNPVILTPLGTFWILLACQIGSLGIPCPTMPSLRVQRRWSWCSATPCGGSRSCAQEHFRPP